MNFKLLKNNGTTLIEVLVASSVLIIGLAAILTSALGFLNVTGFSKNYLIASQLAREGIEVVRNQRDLNWLNGKDFDYLDETHKLTTINQAIIIFYDDPFKGKFFIYPLNAGMDDCIIIDQSCQLRFFSNANYNLYGNGSLTDFTDETINFYRLLTFEPIECGADTVFSDWIGDDLTDLCDDSPSADIIGLEVKATVKWYKNDQLQTLEVTDKLFDWQ